MILDYALETELAPDLLRDLPNAIIKYYIKPYHRYRTFHQVRITDAMKLSYRVILGQFKTVYIEVLATSPIRIYIKGEGPDISRESLEELYEDLALIIQGIEETIRRKTLYFAFTPGKIGNLERTRNHGRITRMFTDSMLGIYSLLILASFGIFLVIPMIHPDLVFFTPFILVGFLSMGTIFAGKIVGRSADWILEPNEGITFLQYTLPEEFMQNPLALKRFRLSELRKLVYEQLKKESSPEPSCDAIYAIFAKFGIPCAPGSLVVKHIPLYNLIAEVAEKFRVSLPKIVILNTVIPNAAAAGPGVKLGVMLVTTGLLYQLDEEEIKQVIGHEFAHLRKHDPLILFGLTSLELLARFYFFWELILFSWVAFFGYLLITSFIIYFIGKILEMRADIISAKHLGRPQILAEALRKIGALKLLPIVKREPKFASARRREWLTFEPHPPLYFRIKKLLEFREKQLPRLPLLSAAKMCIGGVLSP
ncbi:MAG: M48 family metallopeptidase [Candidatus Hodarchaeota archaeon]